MVISPPSRHVSDPSSLRLQIVVFALVSASFTNIYITQPVLPVLRQEFAADMVVVSFTVSAVILGMAMSNLPFGFLVDRLPIHPIILTGGLFVALGGFICAVTKDLWLLIGARFIQGLFIPALTTCLAAYLAKTLPTERVSIVMGSYVSATVLGGMGGRFLGGWIHPPLHWRYAFVSASVLILVTTFSALRGLPRPRVAAGQREESTPRLLGLRAWVRSGLTLSGVKARLRGRSLAPPNGSIGFLELLKRWETLRLYFCAAGSFAIFSSIFNYLPFRLNGPPFHLSTELTTLVYLVYVVGIFMGPTSGRISNRFGTGNTLLGGTVILAGSLALILIPSLVAVLLGLFGVCTGFFTIHASAVGSLNRKLSRGQGRANALYVLFYYTGGWLGITGTGFAYRLGGWSAVVFCALFLLIIPLSAGIGERTIGKRPYVASS
ncbi:MAG TPA: MFS transporter [Thermodesulfobacteriota bacterium]|nr:MFS transporter [Thermodesulfobacteriota bacterium]